MIDISTFNQVVVGAGFWGATLAERLASQLEERVLVIDRRGHVGGNSWSAPHPDTGIEVHTYGSHIFHTTDRTVWEYVNRFATFNHYRHRVLAVHRGRTYHLPINLGTINALYGKRLSPSQARAFIRQQAQRAGDARGEDLESRAMSMIGSRLYRAFIAGYTAKQWGEDPRRLPASIVLRLPVRFDHNTDYFDDPWQGIPHEGYGELFRRLLDHPKITVLTGEDYFSLRHRLAPGARIFYSGPIDRFFDYAHGELGWRTVDLQEEVVAVSDFQGTAVVNYPDQDVPFTRIHEFKHYHPERPWRTFERTVIHREFSRAARRDELPCYPMNRAQDQKLLAVYQQMARERCPRTVFGGRLGSYQYLNMDQAIRLALETFERIRKEVGHG